jgi:hypothetical protein
MLQRPRNGRRDSIDSMAPMDADQLDNNVKPSLLKYVKPEYTNVDHYKQKGRKAIDFKRSK